MCLQAIGFCIVLSLALQVKTWRQAMESGNKLFAEGRYVEAGASFRAALEQAERRASASLIATSLNNLAILYNNRARYDLAQSSIQRSKSVRSPRMWIFWTLSERHRWDAAISSRPSRRFGDRRPCGLLRIHGWLKA